MTVGRAASGLSGRTHHRQPGQQLGGLEVGRHVVTVEMVDQPEIETALRQRPMDVRLLRADHLDLGERMRGAELPDDGQQQRHGRRVHRAHPHHATDPVPLARRRPQPVHRVQHVDDLRQQLPARRAHRGTGPFALQEVDPEFAFEIPHCLAQRGLRQAQFLGGPAQRAEPRHGRDVFQLFGPHARRMRPIRRAVQGFPCHTFVKFNGPRYETGRVFLDGPRGRLPRSTA